MELVGGDGDDDIDDDEDDNDDDDDYVYDSDDNVDARCKRHQREKMETRQSLDSRRRKERSRLPEVIS